MESLPKIRGYYTCPTKYYGARALTTQGKDGVILQSQEFLYEFKCSQTNCTWKSMPHQLTVPVRNAIMSYIPGYQRTDCEQEALTGKMKPIIAVKMSFCHMCCHAWGEKYKYTFFSNIFQTYF